MRTLHARFVRLGGLLAGLACLVAGGDTYAQTSIIDTQILSGVNYLKNQVSAQQANVNALQTSVNTVQTGVNALQTSATAQQTSLLALQASVQSLQTAVAALQTTVSSLASTAARKRYFLTTGLSDGAHALQACGSGFHMASLWELLDTSNLRYDTTRGKLNDDSGSGPAVNLGWVRTGHIHSDANIAGIGNCETWTSVDPTDYGTQVLPSGDWVGNTNSVDPWSPVTRPCDSSQNVWCVQD